MPTISPQVRASIGGNEVPSPRAAVKATTGMNLPVESAAPQKTGQPGTTEDTTPQAVTLSPQLTALARKQQKLQSEIDALKREKADFEASKSDYIPKSAFKAKLQANSVEALRELGTDYDELTNLQLAQLNGDDPVKTLRSEIDQLKRDQEASVNKQYEATIRQYRNEADSVVASDTKAFHFINKGKQSKEWGDECPIVQHIVETWNENPDKILTVEQAAKEIEEFLREDAKAKAAALKELEPQAETPADTKKRLPPPQSAPRTLTQQVETTPTRTYNQFQHLSMKERIAQAIARSQR